jgi:oligoribonuclease NrnB/cAMP/cGMP phosphodiesterase (DHH superfamily)
MKTYVLYHAHCADGFGAALCAWLRFGDNAEYIPCSYGKPLPEMSDGANVIMLDFSASAQETLDLVARMAHVTVIDHHQTARAEIEHLCALPNLWVVFDLDHSGAVLAWRHFHGDWSLPPLLAYIEDRDLWRWALPDSREVSAGLATYPQDFALWHGWIEAEGSRHLANEGRTALRMIDQQVQRTCAHQQMVQLAEWTIPAVNSPLYQSEICEELLSRNQDSDCVACYYDTKDNKRVWSLRSRPHFDCSAVAKTFGGGGHKQAAGFTQKVA